MPFTSNSVESTTGALLEIALWAPIFVAVMALVLSIVVAWQNWRHNRLSVKPILTFDGLLHKGPSEFKLALANKGVGPAIITEVEFRLDGERIEQPDSKPEWEKLLLSMGVPISHMRWSGQSMAITNAIRDGEEVVLLSLDKFKGPDLNALHEEAKGGLSRLAVRYSYTSVYGGRQECTKFFTLK